MLRSYLGRSWVLFSGLLVLACAEQSVESPSPRPRGGSGGSAGEQNSTGGSFEPGAGGGGNSSGATGGSSNPSGGSTSSGGSNQSSGGSAGSGGGSAGTTNNPVAIKLPFAVDDYYVQSGGMGDAQTSTTAIVFDETQCKPRPADARGRCYKVTYTPVPPTPPASTAWAGFFWQYPEFNWGAQPGLLVEPGATEVSFYAASEVAGLKLQALVGISDATLAHQDTVKAAQEFTLTTEMTRYTLNLSDQSYTNVLGPFGWTVEVAAFDEPVVFYLDSIEWR